MTPPNGRPSYLPGDSLAGAESSLSGAESANAFCAESDDAFCALGRSFRELGGKLGEPKKNTPSTPWKINMEHNHGGLKLVQIIYPFKTGWFVVPAVHLPGCSNFPVISGWVKFWGRGHPLRIPIEAVSVWFPILGKGLWGQWRMLRLVFSSHERFGTNTNPPRWLRRWRLLYHIFRFLDCIEVKSGMPEDGR